eukprot:Polyplicarium_translucidae@DN2611_c0_g1_i1.p1
MGRLNRLFYHRVAAAFEKTWQPVMPILHSVSDWDAPDDVAMSVVDDFLGRAPSTVSSRSRRLRDSGRLIMPFSPSGCSRQPELDASNMDVPGRPPARADSAAEDALAWSYVVPPFAVRVLRLTPPGRGRCASAHRCVTRTSTEGAEARRALATASRRMRPSPGGAPAPKFRVWTTATQRKLSRASMFVFFGGKDMVAIDWLPFLSRLLHVSVARVATPGTTTTPARSDSASASSSDELSSASEDEGSGTAREPFDAECRMDTVFVMCEYPGFGRCEGGLLANHTTPQGCTAAALHAIKAALQKVPARRVDLHFVGYSLGTAVALQVARALAGALVNDAPTTSSSPSVSSDARRFPESREPSATTVGSSEGFEFQEFALDLHCVWKGGGPRLRMRTLTLLAPFTSTAECAACLLRVPQGVRRVASALMDPLIEGSVKWDNRKAMRDLVDVLHDGSNLFKNFQMSIFHGAEDRVVPVWMGVDVAREGSRAIERRFGADAQNAPRMRFIPLQGAGHRNLTAPGASQAAVVTALSAAARRRVRRHPTRGRK